MRILATLQEADGGSAMLGTIDVLNDKEAVRKVLGYLPQEFGVYPRVSAYEMLDHIALLKGVVDKGPRKELVEALLQRVNLWEHRKRRISGFSGGMKQRFGIAQSLIGDPKLIIVDEPTAGLDPYERRRFHNLLSEIGKDIIVILSTHIVDDVSNLCTNMAIIDKGKILLQTVPGEIIKEFDGKIWEKDITGMNMEELEKKYHVISTRLFAGKIFVKIYSDADPGDEFNPVDPILEDVYFYTLSTRS